MPDGSKGVLFDVDGTLVDTTFLHAICWTEALRQFGHDVPTSNVHHLIGMSGEPLLAAVLGDDHDTSDDEAIENAHKVLYKEHWGRLSALPGAADLLRGCAKRGLRVVLASSASDEELEMLRATIDAEDAITASTGKSDAKAGKPAPDILQNALDKTGLTADDAVFVGDSKWDGEAAKKAGVRFIGLTVGGTPAEDLRSAGAIEVWTTPADLLEHLDESVIGSLG